MEPELFIEEHSDLNKCKQSLIAVGLDIQKLITLVNQARNRLVDVTVAEIDQFWKENPDSKRFKCGKCEDCIYLEADPKEYKSEFGGGKSPGRCKILQKYTPDACTMWGDKDEPSPRCRCCIRFFYSPHKREEGYFEFQPREE